MATNDFGFGSALAGFESAYSNKANRKFTQEKTKVLADENKRKDIQNVSNTVLGQDAFGVKDGGLIADVPKVMNLSDGAFENWFNAGNNARNYYDKETGETVQGYLLKPKAFKDPETGTVRYSLQIRDKNGDIKPVTTSRSTDPDERPAFVDANFLATIFEGQLANTLTQGGLSGYALGKLQGLNLGDSEAGRIQLQYAEDLNKGTSEQILSATLGVNDIFAEKRTAEDVSSADDVSTIKGGSGETTEGVGQPSKEEIDTLLGLKDKKSIDLFPTGVGTTKSKDRPIFSRGSGKIVSTASNETTTAMKGYIKDPSFKKPFNIKEEDWNSLTPEERTNLTSREQIAANTTVSNEVMPFMKQVHERLANIETTNMTPKEEADLRKLAEELGVDGKGRFKVNPEKIKAIKETLSSNPEEFNKMKQNPEEYFLGGQIGGVKGVTTVPTDIPEDMEGIRTWFADENNVAALQKISPKDAENIQTLLEEKQIASKADLIKRYEQGKLDDLEYKQIALIIAHSLDGGTNPNASMNLYQQFINDKQTGNPGVTADDVRKTDISARDLAHRINKFHTEQANTFTTELKELHDAAVVPGFTTGSKKLDYSTDNAVFISKLKQTMPSFLKVIRSGGAGLDPAVYREQLELMDGVIAKSIDDEIGDSSEGLVDWIGDLFLRGQRTETLGGDFANFQIEYDQTKKQPNGNPLPIRIQFTNTRGNYQLPADESMDWEDFTAKVGDPEVANYIEARVRGS
tara:strand:- start:10849 stop:13083 length:2235 start_codon:yes stop_codon:yes gene_type:complete